MKKINSVFSVATRPFPTRTSRWLDPALYVSIISNSVSFDQGIFNPNLHTSLFSHDELQTPSIKRWRSNKTINTDSSFL